MLILILNLLIMTIMKIKQWLYHTMSVLGLSALSLQIYAETSYLAISANQKVIADVVRIDDFSKLKLFLNDTQGLPYKKFSAIQKQNKNCQISFAMNAGMYHANFAPVGLYIENKKQISALNLQKNQFGNFFMQPNGVLAWNASKAQITTTDQYAKTGFKADYATQSGPMLVINAQINRIFEKGAESLKIRNGVGIKGNTLFFVISRKKINFYDFADIFKTQLKVEQALYLDGSISSAFIPQAKRNDQVYDLGPMLAYDQKGFCN